MKNPKSLAYLLLRLALGFNLFGHGLVRLPNVIAFREWMISLFEASLLPKALTGYFATVLPALEFVIGLLLITGFLTKYALVLGTLLMIALIFGSCLIQQWEMAGNQMIYVLMYFVLLLLIEHNSVSTDQLIKNKTLKK